jgi:hypothetical protein
MWASQAAARSRPEFIRPSDTARDVCALLPLLLDSPLHGQTVVMDLKGQAELPLARGTQYRSSSRTYLLLYSLLRIFACVVAIIVCIRIQWPPWSRPSASYRLAKDYTLPDLYEASIVELQAGLNAGLFTSVDLVKAYFARIEEVNLKGPTLRVVLELNPSAPFQAQALDEERATLRSRGPLHGIPILLKDNIATISSEGGSNLVFHMTSAHLFLSGMNTTAGSYGLLGSIVPRDAGLVSRLRAAGAIILGKANMDEFSGSRGVAGSGWSGRGGQGSNAYFPRGDPDGSSGGSGVAASIGLAAATVGTDTDGSITGPASNNNLAGIRVPTSTNCSWCS